MIRTKSISLLKFTMLATALTVSNVYSVPMNSIADSWHNLGSLNTKFETPSGNVPANHSLDTSEICVFCHTPHGGDNNAAVPIWNRQLNNPLAYTRYSDLGSSTFDAIEVAIGSVTIACLSCHDGGQAIDSLINAPGSGGFNGPPDAVPYGSMPRLNPVSGSGFVGGDVDNNTGKLLTPAQGIVQNLETDLSNDHPVSMQFAGGGLSGSGGSWSGQSVDPDFTGSSVHPGQVTPNGVVNVSFKSASASPTSRWTTLFYLDRSDSLTPGGRDREDIIFYTRQELGPEEPFVECGSCHDPHNINNPTFLRTSNGVPQGLQADFPDAAEDAASGLCLTCHIK
ncbi:MAG: hypothetical protein ACC707_19350 [Thiohalomonadales bacterium]